MGILGLMTLVERNPNLYLRRYELRDTVVVIDGRTVSYAIWNKMGESDTFPWDYDLGYEKGAKFLANLRKCNVTPLVICKGIECQAGNYFSRWISRMQGIESAPFRTANNFFSIFEHVVEDSGVPHTRALLDLAPEAAAIANYLNCPVLSYDSNLFAFDVTFIPLSTVEFEPVRSESPDGYHMNCSVFNRSAMTNRIREPIVPVLAALLGNDMIVYKTFVEVVAPRESLGKFVGIERARKLTEWLLEQESLKSATTAILGYLEGKAKAKGRMVMAETFEFCKVREPSVLGWLKLDVTHRGLQFEEEVRKLRQVLPNVPDEIIEYFLDNKLPVWPLSALFYDRYYVSLGVEDLEQDSAAKTILPVIVSTICIAKGLCGVSNMYTRFVMRTRRRGWEERSIRTMSHRTGSIESVDGMLNESADVRREVFMGIARMTNSEREVLREFDNEWYLFALSLVYWMKESSGGASECAFHSILLTGLATYLKAGRFRREEGGSSEAEDLLSDRLNSVPESELSELEEALSELRRADWDMLQDRRTLSLLHGYSEFLFCVSYLADLNKLLQHPLPRFAPHRFLGGRLLSNVDRLLRTQMDPADYVTNCMLSTLPGIRGVYQFVCGKLCRYLRGRRRGPRGESERRGRPSKGPWR